MHENLKKDNEMENSKKEKNVKQRKRIKRSSLRYCYLFQAIIPEE